MLLRFYKNAMCDVHVSIEKLNKTVFLTNNN